MSFDKNLFSTTAMIVCLATTAHADVSAQSVWDSWKTYWTASGYTVGGTETMSGTTLTVTDLSLAFNFPKDEGSVGFDIDSLKFMENGDGTVNAIFPKVMPIAFSFDAKGAEAFEGELEYGLDALDIKISGDETKMNYAYTADALTLKLTKLLVDGENLSDNAIKFDVIMSDMAGKADIMAGDVSEMRQDMTIAKTDYTFNFANPDGREAVAFDGEIGPMTFAGTSKLPGDMDVTNMNNALQKGFAFDGGFTYEGSKATFSFMDRGDTTNGTSSTESAAFKVAMSQDGLTYDVSSKNLEMNMTGGAFPFPFMIQMAETGFLLDMPISKSETPADFALAVTLGDFVTSDMLWGMFDPQAILPRDPATVSFDLTGKAKLLFDFFDPEQMEMVESGEAAPAELHALKLNNLNVSVAGAQLTGLGDFTFDNTDMESFDGIPKPTGAVDLKLVGGNGLMDKLVQMGLLPQEQAMGARMMMGLFARPGDGEDTLTSKVEINEQGHVIANGQRVQ